MPGTPSPPFLYFKARTGFFGQYENEYEWSTEESGDISDISFHFLSKPSLSIQDIYERKIAEILSRPGNLEKAKENTSFWKKKRVKLCLETIEELNGIGSWDKQNIFINLMLDSISTLLKKGYTIGINFREVFWGNKPPHFRPDIDVHVSSIAEYKKKKAQLSYQFAKAIFTIYQPHPTAQCPQDSPGHQASLYADGKPYFQKNYETPLKDILYFDSVFTRSYFYQNLLPYRKVALAFTAPVSISELGCILSYYPKSYTSREGLTILIKGAQYEKECERQAIHQEILTLAQQCHCRFPIRFVLVTKDNIDANLLELKAGIPENQRQELFQSLPHNAGFYLSSPQILSCMYRSIQAIDLSFGSWLKKLRPQNNKSTIPPLSYIVAQQVNERIRKSKALTRGQLKSKVCLTVTQQESCTQLQTVNAQVQETHTQKVNSEQIAFNENSLATSYYDFSWFNALELANFIQELESYAKKKLPRLTEEENPFKQAGFFTEFYLNHHSKLHFYAQLANNLHFRLQIAAKIFGYISLENNSGSSVKQVLPHYFVDYIENTLFLNIQGDPDLLRDGIPRIQGSVKESTLFGRGLVNHPQIPVRNIIYQFISLPLMLSFHQQSDELGLAGFRPRLNYLILLTEDELAPLEPQQKSTLILLAEDLLNLFKPHSPLSLDEVLILENQLVSLAHFYFPNRPKDIERLKQFIAQFEIHNEDNLKILLNLLMHTRQNGLDALFNLLVFLEERSLLTHFYKIYFQYARNISTIEELLSFSHAPDFLKLAAQIPLANSKKDWPIYESLALHVLLSSAQHSTNFDFDINKLEAWWKRLNAKFLAYCGNQTDEAQELLNKLVQHLITDNGLNIAPVSKIETFYIGLENLLDHAMRQHNLNEQLAELPGISLLSMDAPYACQWNGFQVISAEMQIYASAINPSTLAYSVSNSALLQAIRQHKPGDPSLKTTLFRYLGTQKLREDLAFYRQLYQETTQAEETMAVYMAELLCAYYSAQFTGGDTYHRLINEQQFSDQFSAFLTHHHLTNTIPPQLISTSIANFFLHLRQIPCDAQNGIHCLWSIWQEQQIHPLISVETPIPEIFLRKFAAKQLGYFLATQQEGLETALAALTNHSLIAEALLHHWSNELNLLNNHQKAAIDYLKTLYPILDMKTLLQNTAPIARLLSAMSSLADSNPTSMIYLALDKLAEQQPDVDAFISLLELIAQEIGKYQGHVMSDKMTTHFLLTLAKKPRLYQALPQSTLLMRTLLAYLTAIETKENIDYLLCAFGTLLVLEQAEGQSIATVIIQIASNEQGSQFLRAHAQLSSSQWRNVSQFLEKVQSLSLALTITQWLCAKDPAYNFEPLIAFFDEKPLDEIQCLLTINYLVCQLSAQPFLEALQKLTLRPLADLKKLARLYQLDLLSPEDVIEILHQPALDKAIAAFQRQKYQTNLQRYNYESSVVKEQIAAIKLQSHQNEEAPCLSQPKQAHLWQDYQAVMAYMLEKPIELEQQETSTPRTINELDESEFQSLFKTLKDQITQGINVHANQLIWIAASAEALYRTTNKFPRSTQILALLNALYHPGNLIHEMKTGEGKSILVVMQASLLWSLGYRVDIITENNQLAKNVLEKFGPFLQYLGMPHGKTILHAQSEFYHYLLNGINISTASNLALFLTRMLLEKQPLLGKPALVCDEIDGLITSTVKFRLAAAIDPFSNDLKTWKCLYQSILEFVQEKQIYLDNPCAEDEDIFNLRNYFILKNPDPKFLQAVDKISNELLSTLIESATITHTLEENVDYHVVETENQGKKHYYAAPIIASTKRPDPHVSYSEYQQQLLHTLHNHKKPAPTYPFIIEPSTETLVVTSAKNFFDYYRINNGPIIGLTGTAGSIVERAEFYQQQGLVAFSYPTFHPNRAENLGILFAFGNDDHLQKIFEWLQNHKAHSPSQPVLLITASPQATEQLRNFLALHSTWKLQCYHGHETAQKAEETVIYTAGKNDFTTIANQSLARGADIAPDYEEGLLVINTCTDLTESELRQIQGRTARNGSRGQFLSLINAEALGSPSTPQDTLCEAFKQHQHQLSLTQQQERAKMRLLDEARSIMINQYLLKLRETADQILIPQLGAENPLVDHFNLLSTLHKLNQRAEKHYATLLEQQQTIEEETVIHPFLTARIEDYQAVLNQWFPEQRFTPLAFIEPEISFTSLDSLTSRLHNLTIAQLTALASIFHYQWQTVGHVQAEQCFNAVDKLIELFKPYFNNECSFKQTMGQVLEARGFLKTEQLIDIIPRIQATFEEILVFAQSIPVIGLFIPTDDLKKFITDYCHTTKTQLSEKQWDQVSLPAIDLAKIINWISNLSIVKASSWVASPFSFLSKKLIVPAILGWIKHKLKQHFPDSESEITQILTGIGNVYQDLSETLNGIMELLKQNDITVGLLLDKFAALAKNQAFLLTLTNYLELINLRECIPFVQAIPELVDTFTPYREYQLKKLLNLETFMALLQRLAHSKVFLDALENSPYKASIKHFSQLNVQFITQINTLSFPEFVNLLKVIAHPNFFNLLTKLPSDTSYAQLCQWLTTIPENLPTDSQQAIRELLSYQSQCKQIAVENKLALLNLRVTYDLTLEKFKTELDRLIPPPLALSPLDNEEALEPEEATSLQSSLDFAAALPLEVEISQPPVLVPEILEKDADQALEITQQPVFILEETEETPRQEPPRIPTPLSTLEKAPKIRSQEPGTPPPSLLTLEKTAQTPRQELVNSSATPRLGVVRTIALVVLTLVLVYSVISLSISLALISIIPIGWIMFPYLQHTRSNNQNAAPPQDRSTKEEPLEQTPLHRLTQSPALLVHASQPTPAQPNLIKAQEKSSRTSPAIVATQRGLFALPPNKYGSLQEVKKVIYP